MRVKLNNSVEVEEWMTRIPAILQIRDRRGVKEYPDGLSADDIGRMYFKGSELEKEEVLAIIQKAIDTLQSRGVVVAVPDVV